MNKKNKEHTFEIDFFEFSFLVEACIPPRPIARAYFWDKVCTTYYDQLTASERERLYQWLGRNSTYIESLAKGDYQCLIFECRYNPDNQYTVVTNYNDNIEEHDCFLMNNIFYKEAMNSRATTIDKEYIIEIKPKSDKYMDVINTAEGVKNKLK